MANKQATQIYAANVGGQSPLTPTNKLVTKGVLWKWNVATTETSKADNQTVSESSLYRLAVGTNQIDYIIQFNSWSQSWASVLVRFTDDFVSDDIHEFTSAGMVSIGTLEYPASKEGTTIGIEVLSIQDADYAGIIERPVYSIVPSVYTNATTIEITIDAS